MSDDKSLIVTRVEKPNSFCFRHGGVGTDCKVYFDDVVDLKLAIDAVLQGKMYLEVQLKTAEIVKRTVGDE